MGMVDSVSVETNIMIDDVVLEKGNYQTKDLYFINPSEGLFALETCNYIVTDKNEVKLDLYDDVKEKIPQKHIDRLHLKPNGIIHLISRSSEVDYRLVLESGIIKKIYRADTPEEIQKFPEEIQLNHDAEWK